MFGLIIANKHGAGALQHCCARAFQTHVERREMPAMDLPFTLSIHSNWGIILIPSIGDMIPRVRVFGFCSVFFFFLLWSCCSIQTETLHHTCLGPLEWGVSVEFGRNRTNQNNSPTLIESFQKQPPLGSKQSIWNFALSRTIFHHYAASMCMFLLLWTMLIAIFV